MSRHEKGALTLRVGINWKPRAARPELHIRNSVLRIHGPQDPLPRDDHHGVSSVGIGNRSNRRCVAVYRNSDLGRAESKYGLLSIGGTRMRAVTHCALNVLLNGSLLAPSGVTNIWASPDEVREYSKISSAEARFARTLHDTDRFGESMPSIAELNGYGVGDIVVGAASRAACPDNGSKICQGGACDGKKCDLDLECPDACMDGFSPGTECISDIECPDACVDGFSPGKKCDLDLECPNACEGGEDDGNECDLDAECRGGQCSNEGTCENKGTCTDEGSCESLTQAVPSLSDSSLSLLAVLLAAISGIVIRRGLSGVTPAT